MSGKISAREQSGEGKAGMFAVRNMISIRPLRCSGRNVSGSFGIAALPALLAMPVLLALISAPMAQEAPGRFAMKDIEGGILRMDTRTGRISQCKKQGEEWGCTSIADDSAGLEDRISELKKENDALRAKLEEVETSQATAKEEAEKKATEEAESMPQDEELDRVMAFIEKFMRRFFDFAKTMRNSLGQEV